MSESEIRLGESKGFKQGNNDEFYMLTEAAIFEVSKSGRATCRICLKAIKKGTLRFYAIRGNLDRRMYHWKCGLKNGFTLHEARAREFPEIFQKFRQKKSKGPVRKETPKKGKKRANSDSGKRKKKRQKTSVVRPTFTKVMLAQDFELLKKLNTGELLGLCLYNNIGVFYVNKEKVTIARTTKDCMSQLAQLRKKGRMEPCPCGGLWDYEDVKSGAWEKTETWKCGGGLRCLGKIEGCAWVQCTQNYKRFSMVKTFRTWRVSGPRIYTEKFSKVEDLPSIINKEIDFPNPYLCDEVQLLRKIFSKEICIGGEAFEINEELAEDICSFLKPFPKHFLGLVQGELGRVAMPGTSMMTLPDFASMKKKKDKERKKDKTTKKKGRNTKKKPGKKGGK